MESQKSKHSSKKGNAPLKMQKTPQKRMLAKMILVAPFFMVFIWFTSLVMTKGTTSAAQLSPSKMDILVTVLFAFILCYGAFLFYELRKMRKEHRKR